MTARGFFLSMGITTILAWIGWGVVLTGVDPVQSGSSGLLAFYITLLVALVGTWTLVEFCLRNWLGSSVVIAREAAVSFRHAIILTGLAIACLALSAERQWSAGLFVVSIGIASVIEGIFLWTSQSRS